MMTLRRLLGRFADSTSGAAIIEAAVIIPLAIVLFGGIFDFARAYTTLSAAQKSMRGAVRYLTLLPSGLVCSNSGVTAAKNIALYGKTTAGPAGSELVRGWQASDITLDKPTSCSNNAPVDVVKMSASVPYTSFMWGIVGLPNTFTMNVEYEQRWIGQ